MDFTSGGCNDHARALDSLCFVCGCLIKKVDKFYVVSNYLDFLAKGLRCSELFELDGITPTKFCRGCYSALSHINHGWTVKTNKKLVEWNECGPGCNACCLLQSSQRQGAGRKKKVSASFDFRKQPNTIIFIRIRFMRITRLKLLKIQEVLQMA